MLRGTRTVLGDPLCHPPCAERPSDAVPNAVPLSLGARTRSYPSACRSRPRRFMLEALAHRIRRSGADTLLSIAFWRSVYGPHGVVNGKHMLASS